MSNPQNNLPEGDHRSEKSESKADRVEAKAENRERGEASKHIADGDLNKDIQASTLEKRLSRKSGATGYGVASADSLLPTEAEIQKMGKQLTERLDQEKPLAVIAQNIGDNNQFTPQQPQVMTDAASNSAKGEGWKPLNGSAPKDLTVGDQKYSSDQVTAQDWRQVVKGVSRLGDAALHPELRESEDYPEGGVWANPHRGREDEFIDYDSCAKANKAFPELAKQLGQDKGKIDPDLIASVIRNEQFNYGNIKDTGPDHYVTKYGNWPFNQDESIGPAQIQVQNINALAKEFSKQLGPETDAVKNANTIEKAPYFVAAYFADVIKGIESHKKPGYITDNTWKSVSEHWQKGEKNEALILAYNPHKGQVNSVYTQMDAIKAPDWD
jgi:hypothetical protein